MINQQEGGEEFKCYMTLLTVLSTSSYLWCYTDLCFFAALDICPVDTKALYRRCLALEQTERHEDAYRDARKLIQLDQKNTAIQPVLRRLHATIQDKV